MKRRSRVSRLPPCWACVILLALGAMLFTGAPRAAEVVAEGLLPGMAVLRIDGERVTLRPGQTHGPVTLLEVSGERATLKIAGERQEVGLSGRVDTRFKVPDRRTLSVPRNAQMQYVTQARINGRQVEVLIDTGANTVAMNGAHAAALGIRPGDGVPASVRTASDVRPARAVLLESVSVGGISIQNVTATVLDGLFPETILLGMSYLQHVQLEERDGIMLLQGRW